MCLALIHNRKLVPRLRDMGAGDEGCVHYVLDALLTNYSEIEKVFKVSVWSWLSGEEMIVCW